MSRQPFWLSRTGTVVRYVGSAGLATLFVLGGGAWLVHSYVGGQPSQTVGLEVVRDIHLLTHLPSTARTNSGSSEQKTDMITGFVQIGYTVQPDGKPTHIHVISAEPKGQQSKLEAAKEIIASRHFKPAYDKAGHPIPRQASTVINFQVPASAISGRSARHQGQNN